MEIKGIIKHLRCISVTLEFFLNFLKEKSRGHLITLSTTPFISNGWIFKEGYTSPSHHFYNHCILSFRKYLPSSQFVIGILF